MKKKFLKFSGMLPVVAAFVLMASAACAGKTLSRPSNQSTMTSDSSRTSFFQFTVNSLDGKPVSLEQYRGKFIVVLNVASECGYTPQYADWEKFYEANKDHVVVLGFPCNDFGGQEPGSATEISSFCQKNYGVTFPMFEKVAVKGDTKAPLYQWLTDPAQNGWNTQEPTWNFCKYLINEKGELVNFFPSKVKPDNVDFLKALGM
ncbi:MAG: glutathione peroxidase [Saprospiraceae bacterium]|nr:glutathione peroxidase [Saprospiraceae bacterium]